MVMLTACSYKALRFEGLQYVRHSSMEFHKRLPASFKCTYTAPCRFQTSETILNIRGLFGSNNL